MQKFFFITLLFFSFTGCKQFTDETEVEGRVIDIVTGQPVAGETVQLWEDENCLTPDGCGSWPIEEMTTDSTGRFSFTFDAKALNKWTYHLYIPEYGNRYVSVDGTVYSTRENPLTKHQSNTVELKVCPKGYLKILTRNMVNPQPSDTLKYTYVNTDLNWKIAFDGGYAKVIGEFPPQWADSTIYAALPYGHYLFEWEVIKGGTSQKYSDSIYIGKEAYESFIIRY